MVDQTVIQIDGIPQTTVDEVTKFLQNTRRTNQTILEQSKDPI